MSHSVTRSKRRPILKALRMARADAGLTISELAERAGVSRDTISNAEKGRHGLQATTLHKLSTALGKAPSELLAEEERLAPKVERRSSRLEPTLDDVLEGERLIAAAKRFKENLRHFTDQWQEELKDPQKQGLYWCAGVQTTAIGFTELLSKLGLFEMIARKISEVGEQSPAGLIAEMKKGRSGRAMSDPEFVAAMDLLAAFEEMHEVSDQVLEADDAVDWIAVEEAEQRRKAFSVIQGDLSA
jgi:transcriptional regulator with XRE-family HTH domain